MLCVHFLRPRQRTQRLAKQVMLVFGLLSFSFFTKNTYSMGMGNEWEQGEGGGTKWGRGGGTGRREQGGGGGRREQGGGTGAHRARVQAWSAATCRPLEV